MDNKKIGKLISELRKKKGITQQELGDQVGVGFRAVSKWERGITLPDITIINELSKILGISSDELLSGELKKEHKDKTNNINFKKFTELILIIVLLISTFLSLFIYYNNKSYTYNIVSTSDEYRIDGRLTLNENKISIIVNKLEFIDDNVRETKIKNYEHKIKINKELIVGYGYNTNATSLEEDKTIEGLTKSFRINYNGEIIITKEELENSTLTIIINFMTENGEEITKEIICSLKNTK